MQVTKFERVADGWDVELTSQGKTYRMPVQQYGVPMGSSRVELVRMCRSRGPITYISAPRMLAPTAQPVFSARDARRPGPVNVSDIDLSALTTEGWFRHLCLQVAYDWNRRNMGAPVDDFTVHSTDPIQSRREELLDEYRTGLDSID